MNSLPTIELPPGYSWGWFVANQAKPSIQKADEDGIKLTVVYYNHTLRTIRVFNRSNRDSGYQNGIENITVEEAVPIMAQMVWLGEVT